ncbi:hypothetical protein [Kribbella sp. NPDC051620]|uniref:hypothetical protein n=1 Tax=Kribbella sp. NPDC051620 TaxID=3364120 RepID=UPI0037B706CE
MPEQIPDLGRRTAWRERPRRMSTAYDLQTTNRRFDVSLGGEPWPTGKSTSSTRGSRSSTQNQLTEDRAARQRQSDQHA